MESTMHTNRKQNRCKPLLTCAVSVSAIASKAYQRIQDFDSLIGPTAKKMVTFATNIFPFIRLFQYFLAILSFADDHILFLEKIIQTLFPPSAKLFDKIDNYAHVVENLPLKFDVILDKFPMIVHRVPFLDWALVCMISWLRFFISILSRFGSNTSTEKDIVVDTSGNKNKSKSSDKSIFNIDRSNPSHLSISSNYENKSEKVELVPKIVPLKGETKVNSHPIISDITKCSYKEVLEKGTSEDDEKKDNSGDSNDNIKSEENWEADGNKNFEGDENNDSILDLFAVSWHMKPPKGAKKGSMSRSGSFN